MGLCKCPKRRVTNQFCFEHRVNVCEHCMVQKHPNCVVQSYLQWLQDSDYNPNCTFCDQPLADETCIRLSCYHVFHWVCLDKWARSLPTDTAPAGYCCQICNECIFPSENLVSPVADALRKMLSEVNWARAGLGMPLLESNSEKRPEFSFPVGPRPQPEGESVTQVSSHKDGAIPKYSSFSSNSRVEEIQDSSRRKSRRTEHINHKIHEHRIIENLLNFSPLATNRSSLSKDAALAASMDSISSTKPLLSSTIEFNDDTDDNKYKRRSAVTWFARWWRTTFGPTLRSRRTSQTQKYFLGFMIFLAFLSLLVIFHHYGRSGDDYVGDPMLDPMNNPNIHVGN